jgi:TP901 family phage tail tape measure protein
MAETYKGLVIKIGGDTSELTKSLKASDAAIRTTQKQLRELERAANFKSSNKKLLGQQLDVMSDKATALRVKFRTLNETLEKMGTARVAELEAKTKDAAYNAEHLKQEYAGVCAQIKQFKNMIATMGSQSGLLKKNFGIDEFDVNKIKTDPFRGTSGNLEAIVETMRKLGATEQQIKKYTDELVPTFTTLKNKLDVAKKVEGFKDLKIQMSVVKAEARELATEMVRLVAETPSVMRTDAYQKLVSQMRLAGEEAQQLQHRLQGLDEALTIDPSNIEVAKAKLRTLQYQIENNTERMQVLNQQMNSMRASGIDKIANDTQNLGAKLRIAESELTELNVKMQELRAQKGFDAQSDDARHLASQIKVAREMVESLSAASTYRGLSSEFARLTAETNSLNNALQTSIWRSAMFRGTLQNVGWSLAGTVTPAMQMFAMYSIQAADEVDTAYRNMRKTVQGTEEQFEHLKQAALDYSRTHVTSADTILQIEALGGQLGVATNRLEEFATTVSNLEIATDLDAETAATQLGQLSGILNDMSDRDFAKYGDALTRLGNNSATLESRISDVMLRIASMGTIAGFSTTQLLAWSTAVASTGQGAEAAGTAISKTMSDIESAVGKGGEDLAAFAKVAGMSAQQFADAWKTDPSGAMQSFIQGLKNIEANGGSADNTLVNLGITSVRQKQAILGLTQTIDQLNDNLTMSADAWNGIDDDWGEAGDAAREAQRKAEGFSGALQLLKNNAQAFGVEIGDSVRPVIEAMAAVVERMTTAYSHAPEAVKGLINVLILLTTLAGPALIALSAVANMINTLKTTVAAQKTMEAAAASMGILKGSAQNLIAGIHLVTEAYRVNGIRAAATSAQTLIMADSQKVAAVATRALGVALKAIPWILAISLITELIGAFQSYQEEAKKNAEATDGMKKALAEVNAGAKDVSVSYKNSAQDIIDSATKARDSQIELANSMTDSFSELHTNEGLLDNYLQTIDELAGKCEGNATNYRVLKQAVDGYNEITGQSIKITDSATGTLTQSTSELHRNADAWKANAEAQAYQEAYADVIKQRVKNEAELTAVNSKLAKAEGTLEIAGKKYFLGVGDQPDKFRELSSLKDQLSRQNETLADTENVLLQKMDEANAKVNELSNSTENAQSTAEMFAGKLGLTTDEFSQLTEETTKTISSNEGLQEFFNNTGLSIEEFSFALQSAGISASDLGQKIDEMKSKTQNAFDGIKEEATVTAEEMISTLEHNIEITQNWATNLQSLYQRAGDGAGRSLVDSIAAKGPEYASTVQALLDSDDATWAELIAKWQESGSAAVQAGAMGMNLSVDTMTQAGANAKQKTIDSMTTSSSDGAYAMSGLIEGVDYTLSSAGTGASTAGASVGEQYSSGIASKQGEAAQAAGGMVTASEQQVQSMKDTFWQYGAAGGSNYAVGIWSKTGEAHNAGGDVAWSAVNGLSQYGDTAWQWGAHMGSNFAAGLWSKTSEAEEAARAVADAAASHIKHTIPKKGVLRNGGKGEKPWGAHTVENYLAGVKAQMPAVSKTFATLANTAAASLASGDYQAGLSASLDAGRESVINMNVNMQSLQQPITQWLDKNLPQIIRDNAPNLIIDNDAGEMIVDTRLTQLQGKVMNYG